MVQMYKCALSSCEIRISTANTHRRRVDLFMQTNEQKHTALGMIGQNRLLKYIDMLVTTNNFPSFFVIVAPRGHGKKTTCEHIAQRLGCQVYRVPTLKVDAVRDVINDAQHLNRPTMYLMADCEQMTNQAQNALLKLSEEPPANAIIAMTVSDSSKLLPTILSRAKIFSMYPYTLGELQQFTENPLLLNVCENPGQIKRLQSMNVQELYDTCKKVALHVGKISAWNVFNILRYVKEDDYDLVIPMLIRVYHDLMTKTTSMNDFMLYRNAMLVVYRYKDMMERNKSINASHALEMMFMDMREVYR